LTSRGDRSGVGEASGCKSARPVFGRLSTPKEVGDRRGGRRGVRGSRPRRLVRRGSDGRCGPFDTNWWGTAGSRFRGEGIAPEPLGTCSRTWTASLQPSYGVGWPFLASGGGTRSSARLCSRLSRSGARAARVRVFLVIVRCSNERRRCRLCTIDLATSEPGLSRRVR